MLLFVIEYLIYLFLSAWLLSRYKTSVGVWLERNGKAFGRSTLPLRVSSVALIYPSYGLIVGCLVLWVRHCTLNGLHPSTPVQLTLVLFGAVVVFALGRYYAFLPKASVADRLTGLFDFAFISVTAGVLFKLLS